MFCKPTTTGSKITTFLTALLERLRTRNSLTVTRCNKPLKRFVIALRGYQSKRFNIDQLLLALEDAKAFPFLDAVGIYRQPSGKWHYDLLVSTDDEFDAAMITTAFNRLAYYDTETQENVTLS